MRPYASFSGGAAARRWITLLAYRLKSELINPAPKYVVFRTFDKRHIKAQLTGPALVVPLARAAALSWRLSDAPNSLIINKLGQRVSARRLPLRYQIAELALE